MRTHVLVLLSTSIALMSLETQAGDALEKESKPIGSAATLAKEAKQEGLENSTLCTDANGAAYSLGAVIFQSGKSYRCVKTYGRDFAERKELAWVEVSLRNGVAAATVP